MAEQARPGSSRPGSSRPGSSRPGSASSVPTTAARRLSGPVVLWVGLGGAVGVLLNAGTHALADAAGAALLGTTVGTTPGMVLTNLLGAFLLGLLNGRARTAPAPWDPRITAALGTGLLGAYTSFSALAALLGSPFTTALTVGLARTAPGEVVASFVLGLLLVVLLAAAGTLCAWAGLRVGSRRPPGRGVRRSDVRGTPPAAPDRGAAR